jgi:hypothetical protein
MVQLLTVDVEGWSIGTQIQMLPVALRQRFISQLAAVTLSWL